MTIRPSEFSDARFSSAKWPRAEWRGVYCDLVRRMVTDMDVQVTEEKRSVDATVLRLPGLGVSDSRTTAFRTTRSRAMTKGTDDYIFFMCLEGAATFSHLGRETSIEAGQAILLPSCDPHVIERAMSHHLFITIPKAALGPMAANADAALMTPISCVGEKFSLLASYVRLLMQEPDLAASELCWLAANHIQDLVAVVIGATQDATEVATGRGIRAARLRAIKADIESNLASGDVGSEVLAGRHRVSSRYVRKLFEGEGTSLSQFVLGRRLALVCRKLADPRLVHRTIGAIAFDAGFGDLSTFNHAFRRHFGMTPSEARQSVAVQHAPLASGARTGQARQSATGEAAT
ncbi:helix-turn-helix domain-containing protein [Mesorhizobium caraganae]|uniref:helix-turn-helix domain-containing protein n=1 Tax=Mesorhizobium caraganae TaxID=483206 RepID=UPI00193AAD46|nr:helix-turn-helix domain-containing protein [Mesorhizobium caraganae]MBM2714874.1 helix-turn-helix domain-containing protein [Mesorhizobium caraganae]